MTRPYCEACRAIRPLEELLAYWPIGARDVVRYVCRPSIPSPSFGRPCFARVVEHQAHHGIAPATDVHRDHEQRAS